MSHDTTTQKTPQWEQNLIMELCAQDVINGFCITKSVHFGWHQVTERLATIIARHAPKPTDFYSEDGNTLYDGTACLARIAELEAENARLREALTEVVYQSDNVLNADIYVIKGRMREVARLALK